MSMDLAKKLYAKMPDVFAKARKKFGRGLTLAEKVLVSHADNFDSQTWERGKAMLALRPDRVAHLRQARHRRSRPGGDNLGHRMGHLYDPCGGGHFDLRRLADPCGPYT